MAPRSKTNGAGARARLEAQKIAFAPIAFQIARVLRDNGMLEAVAASGSKGITADSVAEQVGASIYAAKTLLESGLGVGVVEESVPGVFHLSDVGYFVLNDPMTRVNMDFTQDVCYQPMFHLGEAMSTGKPAGLAVFGTWETLYEGLASLPAGVQKSWFAFDHFYSDGTFSHVLPLVFRERPRRILDIGGNTARFAVRCAEYDPDVRVTIVDLPGQLDKARRFAAESGFAERIEGVPIDLLDATAALPTGHDVVWMSQFLVCFSEDEITSIAGRAAAAMGPSSDLYVMDNFWDRQEHAASSYTMQQTSVYFSCVANGNSRMYRSTDFIACLEAAGLRVVEQHDGLGYGHTLLRCRR